MTIDQMPQLLGTEWLDTLEARKREEAVFHDADREGRVDEVSTEGNRRFYDAIKHVGTMRDQWIADITPGRTFLDFACGHADGAIAAAKAGAALSVGIDLSAVSVLNATEKAREEGVSDRTRFLQRDCENTGLPDSTFDAVLCSGMLHHIDLERAMPELVRIMRPGARALCIEALAHNPVFQLYRRLTPKYRTAFEAEHILSLPVIRSLTKWFDVERTRFYGLTSVIPAALPPVTPGRWPMIHMGRLLDRGLCRVPGLKRWSWVVAFELVRRT